jgi:hypothetical protein
MAMRRAHHRFKASIPVVGFAPDHSIKPVRDQIKQHSGNFLRKNLERARAGVEVTLKRDIELRVLSPPALHSARRRVNSNATTVIA